MSSDFVHVGHERTKERGQRKEGNRAGAQRDAELLERWCPPAPVGSLGLKAPATEVPMQEREA